MNAYKAHFDMEGELRDNLMRAFNCSIGEHEYIEVGDEDHQVSLCKRCDTKETRTEDLL